MKDKRGEGGVSLFLAPSNSNDQHCSFNNSNSKDLKLGGYKGMLIVDTHFRFCECPNEEKAQDKHS